MKVVHFVLSNSFAGIEQHVNELLTNINNIDTIYLPECYNLQDLFKKCLTELYINRELYQNFRN